MLFYNLMVMIDSREEKEPTSQVYKDTNIIVDLITLSASSTPAVYSFALKPEEHQPSGTCNFSRIDNAVLNINWQHAGQNAHNLRVYAVNYNVLRVMSGMGGLAYSN